MQEQFFFLNFFTANELQIYPVMSF